MSGDNSYSNHDQREAPSAAQVRLSLAERARLVAMLGRLGSEHDGERAAAGLLVARLLEGKGIGWDDILVAPPPPVAEPASKVDWRREAAAAARFPGLLNVWERDFLRTILSFPHISAKQAAILQRIARKVHGRA